ncbi:MAG: hypothetical protein ACI9XO_003698 [Paraglaciecola sp.]|jgi:hypothetical protein
MTQLFFLLKRLKKASITGYLRLFLAFLKGKRASQMGRLFFINSLSVSIFDVTEKTVFTKPEMAVLTKKINIDLNDFLDGIYLVKVQVGQDMWMQRLVLRK